MIHVPDVRATVEWYTRVGFDVVETYGEGGDGLSFAVLRWGDTQVMFNAGGVRSNARRRDVDLYVYADGIDEIHTRLKGTAEIVEGPHDTFYGMREVIVRDVNGFWVTFGEPSAAAVLMHGVRTGDAAAVQRGIARAASREQLAAALAAARRASPVDPAIVAILEATGVPASPSFDAAQLERYTGAYEGEGQHVHILVQDGQLLAFPGDASGVSLVALDEARFKPAEIEGALVEFMLEGDAVSGLTFTQDGRSVRLHRQP